MSEQRILINDQNQNTFRICKFGIRTDRFGEDYIKFSFPDLKNKFAFNNDNILINSDPSKGVVEFSSHFIAGVTSFKTRDQKRLLEEKSEGKFANSKLMHLLTVIIYDLNHFSEFTKKASPLDYRINAPFNKREGKVLRFFLSELSPKAILPKNSYEDLELVKLHPFSSENKKYRLVLIEYKLLSNPEKRTGVSLFRKTNPTEEFLMIDIQK